MLGNVEPSEGQEGNASYKIAIVMFCPNLRVQSFQSLLLLVGRELASALVPHTSTMAHSITALGSRALALVLWPEPFP